MFRQDGAKLDARNSPNAPDFVTVDSGPPCRGTVWYSYSLPPIQPRASRVGYVLQQLLHVEDALWLLWHDPRVAVAREVLLMERARARRGARRALRAHARAAKEAAKEAAAKAAAKAAGRVASAASAAAAVTVTAAAAAATVAAEEEEAADGAVDGAAEGATGEGGQDVAMEDAATAAAAIKAGDDVADWAAAAIDQALGGGGADGGGGGPAVEVPPPQEQEQEQEQGQEQGQEQVQDKGGASRSQSCAAGGNGHVAAGEGSSSPPSSEKAENTGAAEGSEVSVVKAEDGPAGSGAATDDPMSDVDARNAAVKKEEEEEEEEEKAAGTNKVNEEEKAASAASAASAGSGGGNGDDEEDEEDDEEDEEEEHDTDEEDPMHARIYRQKDPAMADDSILNLGSSHLGEWRPMAERWRWPQLRSEWRVSVCEVRWLSCQSFFVRRPTWPTCSLPCRFGPAVLCSTPTTRHVSPMIRLLVFHHFPHFSPFLHLFCAFVAQQAMRDAMCNDRHSLDADATKLVGKLLQDLEVRFPRGHPLLKRPFVLGAQLPLRRKGKLLPRSLGALFSPPEASIRFSAHLTSALSSYANYPPVASAPAPRAIVPLPRASRFIAPRADPLHRDGAGTELRGPHAIVRDLERRPRLRQRQDDGLRPQAAGQPGQPLAPARGEPVGMAPAPARRDGRPPHHLPGPAGDERPARLRQRAPRRLRVRVGPPAPHPLCRPVRKRPGVARLEPGGG